MSYRQFYDMTMCGCCLPLSCLSRLTPDFHSDVVRVGAPGASTKTAASWIHVRDVELGRRASREEERHTQTEPERSPAEGPRAAFHYFGCSFNTLTKCIVSDARPTRSMCYSLSVTWCVVL